MTDAAQFIYPAMVGRPLWTLDWPIAAGRKVLRLLLAAPHWLSICLSASATAAGPSSVRVQAVSDAGGKSQDSMQRFQRTIIPHLDAAYNFARFLSRDADAAQDIVQEAFLRAYRGFEGFRDGDARAWTFMIVRNCYLAWLQEGRRKSRFEQPMENGDAGDDAEPHQDFASDEDTPETAMIRKTQSQRVRAVIGMLADPMREVLVLRELEDLSYKQIADIIDAPIGTVMSRLARARRDFGDAWQRLEDQEAAR